MYVCEKCGKEWNAADAEQNEYFCTRRCSGALAASAARTTPAGALLERLPFPIAYPWAKSLDVSLHPVQRLNNLIFTAYQTMRLIGLLLLSDYLESDGNCVSLGKPLAKMRMPHWGEWKTLTDSLAKYLAGKNDKYPPPSNPVCKSLADAWMSLGKAWTKDRRFAAFAGGRKSPPPMEIFQTLRNDRAHRLGVHDEKGDEPQLLERHLPLLEFTLEALFGTNAFQLFRLPMAGSADAAVVRSILDDPLAEHIPLISLHGVHADFHFEVEEIDLAESLREVLQKSYLAARIEGRLLPVYPFFLALDLEGGESGGLLEPVSMVDAFSEKKVVHLGVHAYGPVDGLGDKVVELLGRKSHQLGLSREEANRWLMVEWARDYAVSTLQNMTMNKYFPQCYIERAADRLLSESTRHPAKATVITGDAGSGKSSLLCRLVENLVQSSTEVEDGPARQKLFIQKVKDKALAEITALDAFMTLKGGGDVVIFLSGRNGIPAESTESMERAFCRALLRACGVKESELNTPLDFLERLDENVTAAEGSDRRDDHQERKVWIILDAINEVDRFRDLALYLDRFIHGTSSYPWLRLICSCRTGALEALVEGSKTRNIQGLPPFTDERVYSVFSNMYPSGPKEEPRLDIPAFTALETEQAYSMRQEKLPARAALNRYESLAPATRQLLAAPLYLHVFHETWKGKEADLLGITGENTLFEAYLDALSRELPGIQATLESIGSYFYEQETPIWPEEEAWRVTEEWIRANHFDSVLQVCSLTPVETLVSASLLMRPTDEERGYQFSHQKICEQVLKRRLASVWAATPRTRGPVKALFQLWLEKGERFAWLANAQASFLGSWAHGDQSVFLPLLLEADGKVDTALKNICLGVLLEMCYLEQLTDKALEFIRSGFQPGNRYRPFMMAVALLHAIATIAGKTRGICRVLESVLPWQQDLVKGEPERTDFRRDLSVSFITVGNFYEAMGDFRKALEYCEQSRQVIEELVKREPERTDIKRELSVSFNNVGNIYKAMGDFRKARGYFEQSLQVMEELVKREPERTDFKYVLSTSFHNLGNIHLEMGDALKALEYFEQDLKFMQELVKREPERTNFTRDLSVSYGNLGGFYKRMGNARKALQYFEKSLQIKQELVKRLPARTDFKRDLSVSLSGIGVIYQAMGNARKALEYFEQDLQVMEELVKREPERTDFCVDLAISYWNMFRICPAEEEVRWLSKAKAVLDPIRAAGLAGLIHGQLEQLWEYVTAALQERGAG